MRPLILLEMEPDDYPLVEQKKYANAIELQPGFGFTMAMHFKSVEHLIEWCGKVLHQANKMLEEERSDG